MSIETETRLGANRILQHLNHELRQPLSSIESIAYYLEMVLAGSSPDVLDHCAELRRLVDEGSWLLDNAALEMKLEEAQPGPVGAAEILENLAAQMALHEERHVELVIEPGVPKVLAPARVAAQYFDHLLQFFRSVAQCADPMRITLRREEQAVRVAILGNVGPEPGELRKTIDPQPHGNGIRRFMEAAGGTISFEFEDEFFKAILLFKPAEEPA